MDSFGRVEFIDVFWVLVQYVWVTNMQKVMLYIRVSKCVVHANNLGLKYKKILPSSKKMNTPYLYFKINNSKKETDRKSVV